MGRSYKRFELSGRELHHVERLRARRQLGSDAEALREILARAAAAGLLDEDEAPGEHDVGAALAALREAGRSAEEHALQLAWTVVVRAMQGDRPGDLAELRAAALRILGAEEP